MGLRLTHKAFVSRPYEGEWMKLTQDLNAIYLESQHRPGAIPMKADLVTFRGTHQELTAEVFPPNPLAQLMQPHRSKGSALVIHGHSRGQVQTAPLTTLPDLGVPCGTMVAARQTFLRTRTISVRQSGAIGGNLGHPCEMVVVGEHDWDRPADEPL